MSNTTAVKSGAWYHDTGRCRSACRYYWRPTDRRTNLGLRLALDTVQPNRLLKSGSCFSDGRYTRSAYRTPNQKGDRFTNLGLRLAMSIEP